MEERRFSAALANFEHGGFSPCGKWSEPARLVVASSTHSECADTQTECEWTARKRERTEGTLFPRTGTAPLKPTQGLSRPPVLANRVSNQTKSPLIRDVLNEWALQVGCLRPKPTLTT